MIKFPEPAPPLLSVQIVVPVQVPANERARLALGFGVASGFGLGLGVASRLGSGLGVDAVSSEIGAGRRCANRTNILARTREGAIRLVRSRWIDPVLIVIVW